MQEASMMRERALKVVLVLVGLLFAAALYPLLAMSLDDQALRMMLSVYATLGIFLLLAARNPSEHRSLIAFTAWSSFAHAGVMAVQVYLHLISRTEGVGVLFLGIIGVVLIALAPAKPSRELASAPAA
jgi:O-antigen ligase